MTEIARIPYADGHSTILLADKTEVLPDAEALGVFDGNTGPLFPNRDPERSLILPPGEAAKGWPSVERILNRALALSLGRDGLIVAVGGGVVTDVTAFAASLYMRGCRLVLVPTTLLAMVDAAVGGKTGIDFGGAKNLVGTFYPAEEVKICPPLLKSLPEREYRSGLAEVVKHAILAPEGLFDLVRDRREAILRRDPDIVEEMILRAVKVKIEVVSEDLKERGRRALLNLGHTFAHALEAATGFSRWSHGEAVGWGMLRAVDLGSLMGTTDPRWGEEVRRLLTDYGFDAVIPQVTPGEIRKAMIDDKKKRDGRLRFIIPKAPGDTVVTEVAEADLDVALGIR